MNKHLLFIYDTVTIAMLGAVSWLMQIVAGLPQSDPNDELRLLITPFFGSMFVTSAVFLFTLESRDRRRSLACAMFAVFTGSVLPVAGAIYFESTGKVFLAHPILMAAAGGFISVPAFIMIRPIIRKWVQRSDPWADQVLTQLGEKFLPGGVPPRDPDSAEVRKPGRERD